MEKKINIKPKFVIWSNGIDYIDDEEISPEYLKYPGMRSWVGPNGIGPGKINKDYLLYDGYGIYINGNGKKRKYIGLVKFVKILIEGNITNENKPNKDNIIPNIYLFKLFKVSFNGINSGDLICNNIIRGENLCNKKSAIRTLNIILSGNIQCGINKIE
tara:strand:- start:158 stop:634 length:477 start_codon:yes stop_codon:yes gene_type:complete